MERRRRPARLDSAADPMTKAVRRREKPRERWLLTRKTWKYMSDAGRRLIPDGAQNRPEDVPRIEAYFQDVCAKEPRFLLWRKSSYPGALPKPRRKKRARGGSVRARSPSDDAPPAPARPTDLFIGHTSGGRFDIAKLRRDFFATPPPSSSGYGSKFGGPSGLRDGAGQPAPEDEEGNLVDLLRKYLKLEENTGVTKVPDTDELVRVLRNYLKRQADNTPASDADADPSQRTLLENLGRYYCRSPNRDHIVQDLLTDRNLLKRLYHDLRKTKPYRGGRSGGGGGFGPGGLASVPHSTRSVLRSSGSAYGPRGSDGDDSRSPPMSPPPLIEVFHESFEDKFVECGTQTVPIPEEVLLEIERVYRDKLEAATTSPTSPASPPPERKPARRRSSVDHDDVSQSVSDTIKRYLRMARKKSVDADKADRFKRINYDKNLRNIKPRAPGEVDDEGPHKGCQTEEGWILTYRELRFASVASTPTSPVSPSQSHSFLASLLGRGAAANASVPAGGMQKSRSSSSVVQSVSKRLWRTRSRSSSRAATTWTPQGSCRWVDGAGRCVRLTDTSLLTLSEVERRALQQAALARLQQINLGTTIKIPEENAVAASTKPKRRAYLLKRKALTTGFFDQSRTKDADKDKDSSGGSVFGVPLAQCVETERALRRQQHGGSRASLASLGTLEKGDDSESCDSGDWGWAGLEEAGGGGPKVPGLVSACLAHLRRHGLFTQGIFRVSSSKKRVRQLREEWERGQEAALDAAVCPHDVATLLKEFLRDLPDPLLCRDLYLAFINTQKIRNRRLQWEALRLMVQLLPAAHRDTLHALLSFLSQLAAHAEGDHRQPGNKMDAANLATVFAPNILHRNKPNEPARSTDQLHGTGPFLLLWNQTIGVRGKSIFSYAHQDTLHALLSFLSQLAAHAEGDHRQPGNKMDAANLATVFAPNILHRNKPNEPASAEQLSERADVINVVRQLVERQTELWTLPGELLHEAYIHMSHTAPAHLDSLLVRRAECVPEPAAVTPSASGASVSSAGGAAGASADAARRVWPRELFTHGAAATGGPGNVDSPRRSDKSYARSRRAREAASDTSSGSLSSTITTVLTSSKVVRSEEGGSSGIGCTPHARDSAPDSNDSASDYNETIGGSDEDSCVITASLHIPAASVSRARPAPPPRRRSTSGSESSAKRDSAVGSSPASGASSPPASPPPAAALRVTLTATGELRRTPDIDRLMSLGRERNTSDARAVVLRQHDESTNVRTRVSSRQEHSVRREEQSVKREEHSVKREEHSARREDARREERREGTTLYKRGELISSARSPPP